MIQSYFPLSYYRGSQVNLKNCILKNTWSWVTMRILRIKIRIPVNTKKTISKIFGWVINDFIRKRLVPIISFALPLIIWYIVYFMMGFLSFFDRIMIEEHMVQCNNINGSYECRDIPTYVSRQRRSAIGSAIVFDDENAGRRKRDSHKIDAVRFMVAGFIQILIFILLIMVTVLVKSSRRVLPQAGWNFTSSPSYREDITESFQNSQFCSTQACNATKKINANS